MWRLTLSELSDKAIYKNQRILYMGTIKTVVKNIYVRGKRVTSALFTADTKPVFRSESARFMLFIQMSKEMWDFDSDGSGEIMFDKVTNGFLPDLFQRWQLMDVKHLVSIILFTRVEYDEDSPIALTPDLGFYGVDQDGQPTGERPPYKDFYRVVVSEVESGEWATILYQLKREFLVFRRDVSTQTIKLRKSNKQGATTKLVQEAAEAWIPRITGGPSAAVHGNILEAIHLASSQFSSDYIDRDLVRTGISIVILTPSTAVFEVDSKVLERTTEILINNGIGIDLVCLSRMPLHSVPLFKYRSGDIDADERALSSLDTSDKKPAVQANPLMLGSFSSRDARISPSKFTEAGSSPKIMASPLMRRSDWIYAVPQWIDVSFWTGGPYPASIGKLKGVRTSHYSLLSYMDLSRFIPRCRMYEIQMMGVMENALSNISIPYMHESPHYPQNNLAQQMEHDAKEGLAIATFSGESTPTRPKQKTRTTGVLAGLVRAETVSSNQDRDASKRMDSYDDCVFSFGNFRKAIHQDINDKGTHKVTRPDGFRTKDDESFLLGTSYSEGGRSPNGQNTPAVIGFFDRQMLERRGMASPTHQKEKVRIAQDSGSTSGPKSKKQARHISFGLKGFGILPSKAATKTDTDHATAGETLDPLRKPLGRTKSIRSSSTAAKSTDLTAAYHVRTDRESEPVSGRSVGDEDSKGLPTKPIAIRSAAGALHSSRAAGTSLNVPFSYQAAAKDRMESEKLDVLQMASVTKQAGPKIDLSSSFPKTPATVSPSRAMAPWLSLLNPSNPRKNDVNIGNQFRRWQHVFPRPLQVSTVKWKSLCSPAAVPLTTEYFPTAEQLATEYQESFYKISQDEEEALNEAPRSREKLFKELIAIRLSQGYQIVVGQSVAEALGPSADKLIVALSSRPIAHDGATIFMSMGNTIHQLVCAESGEVEIKKLVRNSPAVTEDFNFGRPYRPAIRTTLAQEFELRELELCTPRIKYNWNYVDSFIAGYEENFTDHLNFWCARFVLIPVAQPTSNRRALYPANEDNEEETRLEGIRKLNQIWQRHRYLPPSERHFQSVRKKKKDPNPLDIVYQTRDPSVVINAELDRLPLIENDKDGRRSYIFSDSEQFQRSNVNLSILAQALQSERGVQMQDRRWHWRLHWNCFIGHDFVTWVLENFKDVDTRDEAVELGNELMEQGLFKHVQGRHQLRDGNYFYQLAAEYRLSRPESRGGWFGTLRSDKSVPSTPISEVSKNSPKGERPKSTVAIVGPSTASTPTVDNGKKLKVVLSKAMRYDVDHRKKSYRPEIINLHYDRLHNPDNCYHIRVDWMNVTAKLIEDCILSWATVSEKYGLRLVEVPISEACAITSKHPFRAPSLIRLAVPTPSQQPPTSFEPACLGAQVRPDRYCYQKAIMKKFNFVLDIEAARNFPENVDVTFSWGKPEYLYTQYIHRSGIVLAQITDEGNFLLLANRLHNSRASKDAKKFDKKDSLDRRMGLALPSPAVNGPESASGASERLSPYSSPRVRATVDTLGSSDLAKSIPSNYWTTPERIKNELEEFCGDSKALKEFYDDLLKQPISPEPDGSTTLDGSIPAFGLPPGLGSNVSLSPGFSPPPSLSESSEKPANKESPRSSLGEGR